MMPKEVIRKAQNTLPIQWCVEHSAPLCPEWRDKCWEMATWVQTEDCRFIDAVLLFPERPPA